MGRGIHSALPMDGAVMRDESGALALKKRAEARAPSVAVGKKPAISEN
jgi:hypothetical protein